MSKSTSYKNKLYFTIIIILIITFVLFKLNFSQTINIISQHDSNLKTLQELNSAPEKIKRLNAEIETLNILLEKNDTILSEKENNIINYAEKKCDIWNLTIVELSKPYIKQQEDFIVMYHNLTIEGDFFNMVRFIDELQNQNNIPNIVSVKMFSKKKKYSNKNLIFSQIIFQTIKNTNT